MQGIKSEDAPQLLLQLRPCHGRKRELKARFPTILLFRRKQKNFNFLKFFLLPA
jgi:hypothetical protein